MNKDLVSITGATGFIGWHIAEAFREAGWRVRAVVRPTSVKPLPEGIECVEAPLDVRSLSRAIDGSSVLVHAAGLTRAARASAFDLVNVAGTRAVVAAANSAGARLVLISSQAASGTGTPSRPRREEDEPHPLTAYGRSKLASEREVRALARVPWIILRLASVYGPRDSGFLPLFRLAARGLFPLVADPDTAFTLIYVDDVARGVVAAATEERASGSTLFVGHPEPVRASHVLQHLAEASGRPFQPRRVPVPALRALALAGELSWRLGREPLVDRARFAELRAEGFVCSVDRAREVLRFAATVPFGEGAARTARWYRDQGWV